MVQRNSPERKIMLMRRRMNQLSRHAGQVWRQAQLPQMGFKKSKGMKTSNPVVKRTDGSYIHPTKGFRPKTAYQSG